MIRQPGYIPNLGFFKKIQSSSEKAHADEFIRAIDEDAITPQLIKLEDNDIQFADHSGGERGDYIRKGWHIFRELEKNLSIIIKLDTYEFKKKLAKSLRDCVVGENKAYFGMPDSVNTKKLLVENPKVWEECMVAVQGRSHLPADWKDVDVDKNASFKLPDDLLLYKDALWKIKMNLI